MRPRHAERAQQVAHEGGLAGAERAVQLDEGVAQRPACAASARGAGGAGGLVGPGDASGFLESTDAMQARVAADVDRWRARLLEQLRELGAGARIFPDRRGRRRSARRPSRAAARGSTTAFTARWTTWRARPEARAAGRAGAGHGARRSPRAWTTCRATRRRGWQAIEWQRLGDPHAGRRSRSMRAAATITRCCARACSSWPTALADAVGPFGHRVFTDSAPVLEVELAAQERHRLARQAHAGAVAARPARCSSSARSTSTCALPLTDAGRGALRQLQRLHRRLPDAGDRRAVPARCAALHLVPDDRA